MILLNPGPVGLSERVRAALTLPDLCHREPEFAALQDEIRARLLEVYGLERGDWAPVLISGSGTAAVEAMLASLVPRDGRVLVVENGVYGSRMAEIARCHGIGAASLKLAWGEELDRAVLARALDEAPGVTHVAVVQHETTTGRLNDLDAVAAACQERGVRMLVDAVSGFGAEALDFGGWPLAACAGSANKCLHGAPGLSFVVARRDALARGVARGVYLDLARHARAQDARETAFTPAIPAFYALWEALRELAEEGGWSARHARYAALSEAVERGLTALGVEPLLREGARSVALRAYRLPLALSYAALHDHLKQHGFVIYAGQGALAAEIFRVSTMGAVGAHDLERFVSVLGALPGWRRRRARA